MGNNKLISIGIKGLDEILKGGLIPERFYLIRGGPGTGKTTIGTHFLIAGKKNKETTLFITLTEPQEKIKYNANNFNFNLDDINFLDLNPNSSFIENNEDYDIIPPSQKEQKPLIEKIINKIKEIRPDRIFFDGITQLKYLASDNFNFRKQILSFMQFIMNYNTTILFTSEASKEQPDDDLQFLVDGVINLKNNNTNHTISVTKMRGSDIQRGEHPLKFTNQGIKIYPKLEVNNFKRDYSLEQISSGVPEIDELLHGGIEEGTSTIITGPSGVGKTTLGVQFMKESSGQGLSSVIYTFEEGIKTLVERSQKINIPLKNMQENGNLLIKKIDPIKYSPEEFSYEVRQDIKNRNISIVMLDSITGYFLFKKENNNDQEMINRLHSLSEHLKNQNITVFLINEMKNITGNFQITDHGTSYLSDNIIFLRHLELEGKLQKAIGVLKKRMSDFENTMREFKITKYGIKVGKPLTNLRGILSGNPEMIKENNK